MILSQSLTQTRVPFALVQHCGRELVGSPQFLRHLCGFWMPYESLTCFIVFLEEPRPGFLVRALERV